MLARPRRAAAAAAAAAAAEAAAVVEEPEYDEDDFVDAGEPAAPAHHKDDPLLGPLASMHLRKVVKESHSQPISQIAFFRSEVLAYDNLLATVGGSAVHVYDNSNCGDHLDLFCSYQHSGELASLAWVVADGEAQLAVGGDDGKLLVLSIAQSRVICEVDGGVGAITLVSAHYKSPDIVAVLGKSGSVSVFDVAGILRHAPKCIGHLSGAGEIRSIAMHESGRSIAAANRESIFDWSFDGTEQPRKIVSLWPKGICDVIWLDESRIAARHKGKISAVNRASGDILFARSLVSVAQNDSKMGVGGDGRLLAVGTSTGGVVIIKTDDGKTVKQLTHYRGKRCGDVRACAFATNNRCVFHAAGGGLLWRWDYVDPAVLEEEA